MADVFDLIKARYWANANRVGNLILLAAKAGEGKALAGLPGEAIDVLRAAVVFLHATFEDMLRTLGRHRLGRADDAALEAIQNALGSRNQPYRFTLRELANHRGKSIDAFVDDTIGIYLSTKSFSSTSEVSAFLPMIGLDVRDFADLYPYLSELMTRRHEIVHTADLDRHDVSEPRAFVVDDAAALEVWASTIRAACVTM